MRRRYNLTHLILAGIVVLILTLLIEAVDVQAQIVFISQRDGHFRDDIPGIPKLPAAEIYVMDADGGNLRRLTNDPGSDYAPSWSPDGKRIVFVSGRDGHVHAKRGFPTSEIYVMDADGGNPQNLTNNPFHDSSPSWSPDGKRIAFHSNRDWDNPHNIEIYVMDADGGNPQNLTNNIHGNRHPSWSPNSKQIVFSARREGHFKNKFGITEEIYVMDADGGNEQRLTENRRNDSHPSWSPDSTRIVFSSDRKGDFENFEIYVMDADGGNEQRLTENRVYDNVPSWSPDGERIVFASNRDGNTEIYTMGINGNNSRRLTNNPDHDVSPAWFNSPFSVSRSGKKITMWGRLKQIDR